MMDKAETPERRGHSWALGMQHLPRLTDKKEKPAITQKFIIRKFKPKDPRKKVCHLVAHPANPDAATKPLDYSGPGDSFGDSDQILAHHILGSLQDFKRIAVARGNIQLAELIRTPPSLMTLISAKEESKPRAPKEEKRPPWAPPLQHNFLKNWQRNMALRKQQQEALSEHLKKPVGELLMHSGETYRRIQEERELLSRALSTQPDNKGSQENCGFWSQLECLGDEMMGLVMTKTKTQRGLVEPVTHVRKPHFIRVETGLPAQKDAWYRYTWDRSLFLIYRRKELQSIMAELDFSQQKQVGIAVRLTFETLEGEITPSELTVVNNGTVAIWYDWRRQPQSDCFEDLKRTRLQRFYFNNREGVILPGETKNFTFFFKSLDPGIFRESWEFGTHPTLLGGAVLQVNLHAVSLTQDIFRDERKLLESKLAAHEAVTIVQSVLQELLRGILTPERTPSPLDAYLTEEDLFYHRNPQLHYQHQVVQSLHQLWRQCLTLLPKAEVTRLGEEHLSVGAQAASAKRASTNTKHSKTQAVEPQRPWENEALKAGARPKSPQRKSIIEEILVEESPDVENAKSPLVPDSLPPPEWNLCLEDFRKTVMALPEENQREDALIKLNKAALDLCQKQKPLQGDLLHQTCLQLWRDMIDSLVSHSLWLRALLGLPEKETIYLDVPEEQVLRLCLSPSFQQDRANSKKHKVKDDKKVTKSSSRDRLSNEDPMPDNTAPSQEPIDPLVMEKYIQRLHTEVGQPALAHAADPTNTKRLLHQHWKPRCLGHQSSISPFFFFKWYE
ncbi:MYCBP-associated protein [Tupaia chinensis]|uniref:MYCBP-associated protein n=1 Tax=Tupaia chinensis TaxID=246437 RepID=L8YBM1_TUPCH|nr:MYCBP-associated protein [Tupaia chinensis]